MEQELLEIASMARYPYRYAMGSIGGFFFRKLRDEKRIFGRKCPRCGVVYLPPRPVCGPCFGPTTEWVEVGPRGTLTQFTVVYFTFLDPMTGKRREVPYGYGMVRLDGTDRRFQHFLSENDPKKLKVGMRVEAVFAEERKGNLGDILYFKPVEE